MILCRKLGHSVENIMEATKQHGKPFTDIKLMPDTIHDIENGSDPLAPSCQDGVGHENADGVVVVASEG